MGWLLKRRTKRLKRMLETHLKVVKETDKENK